MKYDSIYERCQSARRLEAILLVAGIGGAVTGVVVLVRHGVLLSLVVFLLSVLAFAMARLFELVVDTLGAVGRIEETIKTSHTQNPMLPT